MFWPFSRSDSLFEASRSERKEAVEKLIQYGKFGSGYYLLLVLATLIVTPGLLLDNVSVIIGGMILAPLMIPILSLSLSLVSGNVHGMLRSLRIMAVSLILIFFTAAILTSVFARTHHVVTWIPEEITPGMYIFIAFCSGVAGAFAWVKENLAPTIAGVAIAVSLLPPVCAAGAGLALGEMTLMKNSLIIFGSNFLGICIAAFLVFWILGFLDAAKMEEKAIGELK